MIKLLIQPYGPAAQRYIAIGILHTGDKQEVENMFCTLQNYSFTNTPEPMFLNGRLSYVLSTEDKLANGALLLGGYLEGATIEEGDATKEEAEIWAKNWLRKYIYRRRFIPTRTAQPSTETFGIGSVSAEKPDHES